METLANRAVLKRDVHHTAYRIGTRELNEFSPIPCRLVGRHQRIQVECGYGRAVNHGRNATYDHILNLVFVEKL